MGTLTARRPSESEGTGIAIDDDFTSSYRASLGRLVGFFRAKGVPREEAADLANETIARMLVHLKRHGRDRTDLGPLVRTIARNLLVERVRKQAPVIVPLGDDIDVADDALEPVDQLVASEQRAAVRQAIGSLSPRHRHVVGLWMEGRTPAEIARELGVKRNAVDAILHRARRSLAAKLDGGGVLGALALVGFRIRVFARRVTDAIVSLDPTGQSAPAGLAFATMGVAAVLSITAPSSAAATRPAAAASNIVRPDVAGSVTKAEQARSTSRAPIERVKRAVASAYEVDVVRAPVTNPVTGEEDDGGISIVYEPEVGRHTLSDKLLQRLFESCASMGTCSELTR